MKTGPQDYPVSTTCGQRQKRAVGPMQQHLLMKAFLRPLVAKEAVVVELIDFS